MKHMKTRLVVVALVFLFVSSIAEGDIRVVSYNTHYCSADMEAMNVVIDGASLDDSHGESMPVSIFMFQEVKIGAQKTLHGLVGETYSMATYTNAGESGGAQAMFFESTQFEEKEDDHEDIFTGATRNADRWHLVGIGKQEGIDLWVYSAHLKASKGNENKLQREAGAKAILEDIATLKKDSHVIVAGDMNFYTIKEPAYILFTASLVDPLGTDEWAGTDDASKHTQSPRKIRKGGLASGGMDDRFDFQFISNSLDDGKGLDIIEGSYHAMGNDGTHYDIAINDGDNSCFDGDTDRSNLLAQALHDASDHIPVMVDFEVIVEEEVSEE
jgi:endonuclease/exonuclease/phosphatase family metal-dependent hydrolase